MPYLIAVNNLENGTKWQNPLSEEEYLQLRKGIFKGKNVVALIPATLFPVRSNNAKNFFKDFFLPTTLQHALKVKNLAEKIFAFIFSLILDLATLPIRIVTSVPRIIFNYFQPETLLYGYLMGQRVDKKLIEADTLSVRLEWGSHSNDQQQQHWEEQTVNLRAVHDVVKHEQKADKALIP